MERMLREAAPRGTFPILVGRVADACGVSGAEILSGSCRRPTGHAHAAVAAVAVRGLGPITSRVAKAMGVSAVAVLRGIDRGLEKLRARRLNLHDLARGVLRKVW